MKYLSERNVKALHDCIVVINPYQELSLFIRLYFERYSIDVRYNKAVCINKMRIEEK